MTLYVYTTKATTWDDIDAWELVTTIDGEDNADCERKAADAGYDDPDTYAWTYSPASK